MEEPHLEIWPWQDRLLYAFGASIGIFYAFYYIESNILMSLAGLFLTIFALELGRKKYLNLRDIWLKNTVAPLTQVEHLHSIIRAEVKNPFISSEITKDWLVRLVKAIGMNITENGGPHVDYVEKEGNCGIAGIVMIETSHCSIHIWDQQNPPLVQMDVYSCANYDLNIIKEFLNEMNPTKVEVIIIDRKYCLNIIS